jgi:pyrroloquinoline quinone biosynthesis protein B
VPTWGWAGTPAHAYPPGMRFSFALLPLLALMACSSTPEEMDLATNPYVLVLGSAQDGGLPQLACSCEQCVAARDDPRVRRFVVAILLVDPRSGARWLFEATPDIAEQVEFARGHGGPDPAAGGRPALFDGIFLTHAHIGHYTGLMQLGREAYGSAPTPVHGTPRLLEFLQENGPWDLLFSAGHLEAQRLEPGARVELGDRLSVQCFPVPHREEYSDTVAFLIRGPNRSLLFLPDTDKWTRFDKPVEELIALADHAILDGTFFSGEEIPGRDISEIPHPFLIESIERFAALSKSERAKIHFTHLNHSNPAADPTSEAAARVRAAGLAISSRGDRFGL